MKSGLALLLTVCLFGCRTRQPYSESLLLVEQNRCEESSRAFVDEYSGKDRTATDNVVDSSRAASSYALMTLGYTSDVLMIFTTGAVVGLAVCMPVIAVESNGKVGKKGDDSVGSGCITSVSKSIVSTITPQLGKMAGENTIEWRSDATHASSALRSIASCYERRGSEQDLINAMNQLQQIKNSRIYSHSTKNEQSAVDESYQRVTSALKDRNIEKHLADFNAEASKQANNLSKQTAWATWIDMDRGLDWRYLPIKVGDVREAGELCNKSTRIGEFPKWRLPNDREINLAIKNGFLDAKINPGFSSARSSGAAVFFEKRPPDPLVSSSADDYNIVYLSDGEYDEFNTNMNMQVLCVR